MKYRCKSKQTCLKVLKMIFEGIPYEFHSDSKAKFWIHYGLVILGFLFAVVTLIAQWRKPAPYGKHEADDGNWGVLIPQRLGHILSDATPGILLFILIFIFYGNQREYPNYIFLSCWLLHYIHRGLIHPLIMRYRNKMVPLGISVGGFIPNCLFHFLNADFVGNSNFDSKYYYDPRFILGLMLFVIGYIINKWADFKLRSLRHRKGENESLNKTKAENAALKESQGERGYYIPHGGLYELITCPNYFGELVEWMGWSVLTWSLAGLVFMMFSSATFIPRSKHNHNWYKEKFELYPKGRKALIPFIY